MKLSIPQPKIAGSNAVNDIVVDLMPGKHTISTPLIPLTNNAINQAQPCEVRLEMSYEYIPDIANMPDKPAIPAIKLSASDYTGEHAPKLIVNGEPILSAQIKEIGAESAIKEILDKTIENAQQAGLMVLERKDLMPLTKEQEEELMMVYRDGFFLEPYCPGRVLEANEQKVPLTSTFGGVVTTFYQGSPFYNVIGSTNDPCPTGFNTWISVWATYSHTSLDVVTCVAAGSAHRACIPPLCGGHVVIM